VLHDRRKAKHPRGGKEQDNRAQKGITQRNLLPFCRVKIRQAPQLRGGPDSARPIACVARSTIPPGNTPSLARGPSQDHNNTPCNGKVKPAGNTSTARQIAKLGINGHIKADNPHGVMDDGKRLV